MVNKVALGAQTEGWRGWAVLQAAQLLGSVGLFPLAGWVSLGTRPLAPCPGRVRQWGGGPTVNKQPLIVPSVFTRCHVPGITKARAAQFTLSALLPTWRAGPWGLSWD